MQSIVQICWGSIELTIGLHNTVEYSTSTRKVDCMNCIVLYLLEYPFDRSTNRILHRRRRHLARTCDVVAASVWLILAFPGRHWPGVVDFRQFFVRLP